MEKCAVCKQPFQPNDRIAVVDGKKVHEGSCKAYMNEVKSGINESTIGYSIEEVELL